MHKSTKDRVLRILNDGAFHSGEEIAAALSITRAAVGKHVTSLKALGLDIFGVTGKGYRLREPVEFLSADKILEHTQLDTRLPAPIVLPVIASTNQYLLERIEQGLESGQSCFAECQTAGRGRRGRSWLSPFGANVYTSLYWRLEEGLSQAMGLSLVVGVSIYEALKELGIEGVRLKWPNDVLRNDRKLAGILVELEGDPNSTCHAVIGIGINYRMPPQLAGEIDQPWTDLVSASPSAVGRNRLCANLLTRLVTNLEVYQQHGFTAFAQRWREADRYYNEAVHLIIGNQRISGTCLGVNAHGALLLETEEGTKPFYGGEISLRPGR